MPRICWILILFGALERELLLVFLEITYICSRLQKSMTIYIYIYIYIYKNFFKVEPYRLIIFDVVESKPRLILRYEDFYWSP
jgi:hypothetical protein